MYEVKTYKFHKYENEKDIKMCKTKKTSEGKALRSPLYFFEKREMNNVASMGPPHMTAGDVDCTTLGTVKCTPAQLCRARLTQALEGVKGMAGLLHCLRLDPKVN